MKQSLTILLLLSLFFSCSPAKKLQKHSSENLSEHLNVLQGISDQNTSDKIVFLTFEVTQSDTTKDQYDFRLVNKIFANGSLKKNPFSEPDVYEPNYLYCELTSSKNQKIDLIKTEDPLNRVYEFPGDGMDLEKQTIKKRTGQFTIRFQFNKDIKYLSVLKPANDESKTLKKIYYATL